ncbi:MAG: hypothetical protein IKZ08_03690 [Bacteroidales bacterium]|nr:hypothetical protein [Bacteroidales bacterium]MBR5862412.1 hypothetical protein [Bacteroidales bacterium]
MAFRLFRRNQEKRPSMRVRLVRALGSIAAVLLLSGIISILEYRRMSDYVSELISSNIESINLSQRLADITREYDQQMLAVVVTNDIAIMPNFDLEDFTAQADSLKASVKSPMGMEMVDSVVVSFDAFMRTSMKFDEVFLADSVDTGEWFFGTLQPRYNKFRDDINVLNESIHDDLQTNSANFDAGFYRSIIPGVVSVGAGLLMIFLLLYFIMVNYVNPIYRISDGIDAYKATGRVFKYVYDGDDQLANINTGVSDLTEENHELKRRIKALREKE